MPLVKTRSPLSLAKVNKLLRLITYELDLTMHQVSAKCFSDKAQVLTFTSPPTMAFRAAKAGSHCSVEALGFRLEGITDL